MCVSFRSLCTQVKIHRAAKTLFIIVIVFAQFGERPVQIITGLTRRVNTVSNDTGPGENTGLISNLQHKSGRVPALFAANSFCFGRATLFVALRCNKGRGRAK